MSCTPPPLRAIPTSLSSLLPSSHSWVPDATPFAHIWSHPCCLTLNPTPFPSLLPNHLLILIYPLYLPNHPSAFFHIYHSSDLLFTQSHTDTTLLCSLFLSLTKALGLCTTLEHLPTYHLLFLLFPFFLYRNTVTFPFLTLSRTPSLPSWMRTHSLYTSLVTSLGSLKSGLRTSPVSPSLLHGLVLCTDSV